MTDVILNTQNRYGLNLEKTIFVVDSPATAFMVSILADGQPVNVILEMKEGLETENASELLNNFIHSCIELKQLQKIRLPHRFYISGYDIHKIWEIKQATRKLYDEYSSDTTYIGASTSTFIRSIPSRKMDIAFLYHGMTDCIRQEEEQEEQKKLKNRIKRLIIGKFIGLPCSNWCNYWPDKAFSLCDLNNDPAIWINMFDFKSDVIDEKLSHIGRETEKNKILFFPLNAGHTAGGVDSDTIPFNQINQQFIKKYINMETDIVYIKYHPWLYRANNSVKSDFISVLERDGIEAIDTYRRGYFYNMVYE